MENMYLTFTVGAESYGVEIRHVIQIISIQQAITQMPEMPAEMQGFINLRGEIIPVFSLRARFGKDEREADERSCIIIVDVRGTHIGLIVDGIRETVTIEPEYISRPDNAGSAEYISGIARTGQREETVVILIDLPTLFRGGEVPA
jgi:purine-binding chemotaxis protein CheW